MEVCSFIVQSHSFNSRQGDTDIVCADYFKVIIFWEKLFMKNGSFTDFWFVRLRNRFMIHKSQTLNSSSVYMSRSQFQVLSGDFQQTCGKIHT